jgi:hypothetical protein
MNITYFYYQTTTSWEPDPFPCKIILFDAWIKKMWYMYTVEIYSAIKNEIMLFAGKWMELKIIKLNK